MNVRSRGISVIILIVLGALGVAFAPDVDPFAPSGEPIATSTASGAWFCPHGGGEEWKTTLAVANPGESPVKVRVTTFAETGRPRESELEVPAVSTRLFAIEAPFRESSSMVEYFGGWVAAGWVTRAAGDERGVAAEPCISDIARTWYLPDASTVEDEDDALVLSNPFAVDAVVSVTLLTPGREPTRTEALTNLIVRARTTKTVRLGRTLLGETTVSAIVDVSVGRVAAGMLAITGATGIRASIGYAGLPVGGVVMPGGDDSGRSELVLMLPPGDLPTLSATLLGSGPEQPVAGIPEAEIPAGSSRAFPVSTAPASAIVATTASVPAARRHGGRSGDDGSSIGVLPSSRWVVLPAVTAGPFHSGIVLVNPGENIVTVSLRPLGVPVAAITVSVPARGVVSVPAAFADAVARVGVLVVADGGPIVAATTASSLGKDGYAAYAVADGVAVPQVFLLP